MSIGVSINWIRQTGPSKISIGSEPNTIVPSLIPDIFMCELSKEDKYSKNPSSVYGGILSQRKLMSSSVNLNLEMKLTTSSRPANTAY